MSDWLTLVLDCMAQTWRTPAGDPGVLGWGITLGYATDSIMAFSVAGRTSGEVRERLFWIGLGIFLLFLTLNKQLDLQVWMTATGRCVARAEGWYRQRRAVQTEFVQMIAIGMGMVIIALLLWLRSSLRRNWIALLGLVVLAGFILQRAVSIHHVDRALRVELLGLRSHTWIELAGIAIVLLGAVLRLKRRG